MMIASAFSHPSFSSNLAQRISLQRRISKSYSQRPEPEQHLRHERESGTMPTSFGRRAGFLIGVVATRIIMPVFSEISVRFSPNGMLQPSWKSAADIIRDCFRSKLIKGRRCTWMARRAFRLPRTQKMKQREKNCGNMGLRQPRLKKEIQPWEVGNRQPE